MPDATEGKIRILIVDDIAETRENIRKLLQFEADFEVVGAARTGDEALQVAIETQPDVVLMDINMPDMDGITATEAILDSVHFAQIVILSVQSDADYMRRAMLAGARDFIAKPPSGDELVSTIRRVAARAKIEKERRPAMAPGGAASAGERLGGPSRPEGRAITVYSAKGGVGVTMLATNIAIGLNTAETPVVLVDTALQFGDVAVVLNLQPKNSMADMASRADELDADVMEEVLINHDSGLKVLAAPPRPEVADEIKPDQVRKVLQFLKRNFAYVIIDTSSGMDDFTLAALDGTDLLVAVATPDIPAIKDARLLFDLLSALGFQRNNIFFVLNKMDKRTGITAEAVAENLKHAVDGEIPYDDRVIPASINRGVPVLMTPDKSRPPGRNILELLGAIKQRLLAQTREEPEEAKLERPKFGR